MCAVAKLFSHKHIYGRPIHTELILQPFCVTSPTSKLILQPFRRFDYVTAHSPTLPSLHLRHSSFSNPSLASPTSQALRLIHLASLPCDICLTGEEKLRKNLTQGTLPDRDSNPGPLRDRSECYRLFHRGGLFSVVRI